MRALCFVLFVLGLPAVVIAQPAPWPETRRSAIGPIGLPLPSIGLPLPPIGLPPAPPEQWRRPALAEPQHRPLIHPDYRPHVRPSILYVVPSYPWLGALPYQLTTPQATVPGVTLTPQPLIGRLRLEVEPADLLQLFVDGVYVGTPRDLGNEIDLPPGSRRIEIRAPGHKTLVFDAQIAAHRTITYRGALEPVADVERRNPPARREADAPAAPPVVAAGSRTLYVIPGCYLGNVPPREVRLPAGCDIARLTTHSQ